MSQSYIFFLGSHPDISRAEIAAVLAARGITWDVSEETDEYLLITSSTVLDAQLQDVLGGSDRFAQIVGTFSALPTAADMGALLPSVSKKISVGLSGLGVDRGYLNRLGIDLKEWATAHTQKLRFILPSGKGDRLNAAAVMAHRLDVEPNSEFTLVRLQDESYIVAKTVAVQDIRSYELRDTQRPARDAAVGLLPPKLAQIMLNLAGTPLRSASSAGQDPLWVLDPFCGMGTILQEGWLMDYQMVGSDESERMIKASTKNLAWLKEQFKVSPTLEPKTFVHQADTKWAKRWHNTFDAIVTEPYLGKPVKGPLPPRVISRRLNELGELYQHVFRRSLPLLKEGGALVFALPAFRTPDGWQLFPEGFLDALARLGYSKVQLGNEARGTLLYARPDALVGRELTLWRKNNGT